MICAAPLTADGVALTTASRPPRTSVGALVAWALLLGLLAASWKDAEIRPLDLLRDAGNMVEYGRGFFPPDLHDCRQYLQETIVTFEISLWRTVLAVLDAVPLGLLASANITPWWVHQPVRRLLNVCRAAVLLMLVVSVTALDLISARIRKLRV